MSTFDVVFYRLLGNEGELSLDHDDPGNWTSGHVGVGELRGSKYGISAASYPSLDIKNLDVAGAKVIYARDFWDRIRADQLYDGVAFQLFDFAVNSGIETAVRYYQRALGVADDGHFGPISLAASQRMSESDQIMGILGERLDYMTRLSNWPAAGRGWARRIATDLRFGVFDS